MAFRIVMIVANPMIPHDEDDYRKIGAEFVAIPCQTENEIIAATQDADTVITVIMKPLTRKVIERLNRCKLIYNLGTGYETIDIEAATEHGICVSYPADYCTEEVAEHTMALIVACARKLCRLDRAVRAGKWDSEKKEIRLRILPPMFQLREQTLGLIGFGRIAQRLVPKAKGFDLSIIAFDPYMPSRVFEELGVGSVTFDYLLQNSDYVSLHVASTPEARHMLGIEQFKVMKPTAYVINCARGELIDEQALYVALTQDYIAGAALDVLEKEVVSLDHPLLGLENVIITPHSAYYSAQSSLKFKRRRYEEIARIIQGKWPQWLINPEVKEKFMSRWGRR